MSEATVEEGLTIDTIKSLIANATEREVGLSLWLGEVAGRSVDTGTTLRNTKPGVVRKLDDGRIGFHVDGMSFLTQNSRSGRLFLAWLTEANKKAVRGEDYGQPPKECTFRRHI